MDSPEFLLELQNVGIILDTPVTVLSLEKNNILTNEIDSKDYYPRYGHDSEQLLNDCYNYIK